MCVCIISDYYILLYFFPILQKARECYSDHGAAELLFAVLPSSRNTAHLHLPSPHLPHPRGFGELSGSRSQRGERLLRSQSLKAGPITANVLYVLFNTNHFNGELK